jgi:FkbM family methyltransferase
VSKDIIRAMKDTSNRTKHATDYMLSEPFIEFKPEEVDGLDTTNNDPTFTSCLLREVITERIYERYRSVQDGEIVVDIGANIGLFPWSLKRLQLDRAIVVEPSTSLIPALTNNMSKLPFPVTVFDYAIGGTTEDRKVGDADWLAGDVAVDSTIKVKTFKDFLADAKLDRIDFLKVDCEGGEYDIFTEENYEFLTKNVKYITGEWHLSYAEDGLNKFINFKNLYLKGKNNFRVFEPYDWREVTHKILDDAYLHEFYNWRNPRNKGAQFMVYIDNG